MNTITTNNKLINESGVEMIEVQSFKKWLTDVTQMIKPKEGLRALVDVISSINTIAEEIFTDSGESIHQIDQVIKHTSSTFSYISLISDLQWWLCQKCENNQEKLSRFLFTTIRSVRLTLSFLDKNGYDTSVFKRPVFRIPFIDLTLRLLSISGTLIGLLQSKEELDKATLQAEANLEQLTNLKNSKEAQDALEMKKWTMLTLNDRIIKEKKWLSIALDMTDVSVSALGLAITAAGLCSRHAVGKLMISLDVMTSFFWFYKCYHEEKHRNGR